MCRAPGVRHCSGHPSCGVPRSDRRDAQNGTPAPGGTPAGPPYSPEEVVRALDRLRAGSGSHSPSVAQIEQAIPGLVQVDACFLSNPYATDVVMGRLREIPADRLERMVAHYPSQTPAVAAALAPHLRVPAQNLHLGNGACEVIQSLLASRPGTVLLSVPTFSAYYEFAQGPVVTHQLQPDDDFRLELDALEAMVYRHAPQTVVIINPNNPDGGPVATSSLVRFIERVHASVGQIIVDESFSHFAGEEAPETVAPLVAQLPRLVVVNSLSKSHGIAGLRLGYAVMAARRVRELRESALWNLNTFAEWFCGLLGEPAFQADYEQARRRYVRDTRAFFGELGRAPGLRAHPTAANFALVQVDRPAGQVAGSLLAGHGIYVRDCGDKRGLDGDRFLRIASRTAQENQRILHAVHAVLGAGPFEAGAARLNFAPAPADSLTEGLRTA
jgi:histidinol-phosphate/aromatic aminotransferase/cobyric acid decarboxylase-like protein